MNGIIPKLSARFDQWATRRPMARSLLVEKVQDNSGSPRLPLSEKIRQEGIDGMGSAPSSLAFPPSIPFTSSHRLSSSAVVLHLRRARHYSMARRRRLLGKALLGEVSSVLHPISTGSARIDTAPSH